MEDTEFASCYRRLISHYQLTPEESARQFAEILRRIDSLHPEAWDREKKKRNHIGGGNHHGDPTAGEQ